MRAIRCTRYGPPEVLELVELPTPTPAPDEVRIRIHATTAHVGDARVRGFRISGPAWLPARMALGFMGPRNSVLGMEVAGVVDAVGDAVTRFEPGDRVAAFTGFRFGGYAEWICLPEDGNPGKTGMVVALPDGVGFAEAAPLAGSGVTALLVLRRANLKPGRRILVYGASGSIGTYAVQLAAHHFGAEVTAVCSTPNLELVRTLGATETIDYTRDDLSEHEGSWDVVFDAVDKLPAARARPLLRDGGTYLNIDKASNGLNLVPDDLALLAKLVAEGSLRSVIDRTWPLEQIVEAHRYVDLGHKRGNVSVLVQPEAAPVQSRAGELT